MLTVDDRGIWDLIAWLSLAYTTEDIGADVGASIAICYARVCEANEPGGDAVAFESSNRDQPNLLLRNLDSGEIDSFIANNAVQEFTRAVANVEILVWYLLKRSIGCKG